MGTDDKILIFIPAYNCSEQIGRVLAKVKDVPHDTFAAVLVLDNQSPDGTANAASACLDAIDSIPVIVGRNKANYGLGGSHKVAFQYAAREGYTHVVVLHGDDQGDIGDLLPVLAEGRHNTHDCCLGARFMRGSRTPGYSTFRKLGNHVFNLLFSAASGQKVSDLGSGLNIFGRAVFEDEQILKYSDDLRFNCYLLLSLTDRRRSHCFFPISWREEDQISNVKLGSQSLKTLQIVFEYVFRRSFFRSCEHRAVPYEVYGFDVIRSTNPPDTRSLS